MFRLSSDWKERMSDIDDGCRNDDGFWFQWLGVFWKGDDLIVKLFFCLLTVENGKHYILKCNTFLSLIIAYDPNITFDLNIVIYITDF